LLRQAIHEIQECGGVLLEKLGPWGAESWQ
jgi:hypothetical protein